MYVWWETAPVCSLKLRRNWKDCLKCSWKFKTAYLTINAIWSHISKAESILQIFWWKSMICRKNPEHVPLNAGPPIPSCVWVEASTISLTSKSNVKVQIPSTIWYRYLMFLFLLKWTFLCLDNWDSVSIPFFLSFRMVQITLNRPNVHFKWT